MKAHADGSPIRIWVPGCSTGEEVYSIVIALLEYLGPDAQEQELKVLGTDLSEAVITKARAGRFLAAIAEDVSPERLSRFFVPEGPNYQIVKSVRDHYVFARQDATRDPPFSNLDLISCRNVLIYLGPELQARPLPIFHYALEATGFLVLGRSESVGIARDLFSVVDPRHGIHARRPAPSRPRFDGDSVLRREFDGAQGSRGRGAASPTGADVIREADRLDLARAPAGIIVDEAMAILQFRGDTGTYLSPASGAPTHRLLSMAREGLGPELCAALDEAQRLDAAVTRRGVRFKADDGWRHVDLKVEPIRMPHGDRRCHLIQFTDANGARGDRSKPRAERAAAAERELAVTKDYLQAIISDQQAVTEELETANEEILSSNEELQSTNEELLMVNDELAQRNREATLLSEHLTNLLTSVRIPILMLGRDLRIRRFTPPAGALLNLLETDVGRPITDIALRLRLSGFEQLLRGVIHTLVPTQRDVQDLEGRWHVLAIHPYRTLDDRIDGVVVSLTDVNEARISARRVANLQAYAESIVNSVSQPLVVLDASLRVRTVNVTSSESFGMPPSEAEGRSLTDLADWFPLPTELMDALGEIAGDGGSLDGHEVDLDLLGRGRRTLRMIEESVRSASDLCDRLLSYAGHRERVPMPCHLGALVMSASRLAQVGLGSSTRIQFDLAADLPPIRVDPTQIQQVLMNLILNAAAALRGHGTVLVIDDEASVRTITVKLLELLGFTAIGVASGREAVAMFREQGLRFRLVLLDLTMPGLGGEATFRELRALRSDVRVVLMSGYGQEDAVERLRMEGLVGFLPKPFGREQLTSLLLSVLGDD